MKRLVRNIKKFFRFMSRIFIHRESYMLDLTLEVKDNTSWVKNNISRTGGFICDTIELTKRFRKFNVH